MNMLKAILLLTALCWMLPSRSAYEDPTEAFQLKPEEVSPSNDDIVNRRKEQHQWDEKLVKEYNDSLGITDKHRWTGEDRSRLSGAFHLNGQYEHLSNLQGFEATWLRRTENWAKLWWGATFRRANAGFGDVATNHPDTGNAHSEGSYKRPSDAKQTIQSIGLGVGYRFRLLLDFINTENWFETVQVFGTRTTLNDAYSGNNYQGWGMTADYALHRRTRTSFFWGPKFSYNIAWVQRSQAGTESSSDRSLSLGWYTFALEAGFYY